RDVISLRKPSADAMARLAAEQGELELTYDEHGATDGEMPPGYSHDQCDADLGPFSQERFDRLSDFLSRWRVQQGCGMTIAPAEPVVPGLTFALAFGLAGRLGYVVAAGRVVYTTDEP